MHTYKYIYIYIYNNVLKYTMHSDQKKILPNLTLIEYSWGTNILFLIFPDMNIYICNDFSR